MSSFVWFQSTESTCCKLGESFNLPTLCVAVGQWVSEANPPLSAGHLPYDSMPVRRSVAMGNWGCLERNGFSSVRSCRPRAPKITKKLTIPLRSRPAPSSSAAVHDHLI